jgi:glycosyltransferase involved in cell wall biosynthesis
LLFIGNFLSAHRGSLAVCEALSARLREEGWSVRTASSSPHRAGRLADMLQTVIVQRHRYDVAHVDVFSGSAFVWAEVVCEALMMLGKPFVLSLHGGALPEFAAQHPRRVRRLLARAACVTAPSRFLQVKMAEFAAGDLHLYPNAIDINRFAFRLRAPAAPRLLWLRAFHEVYNPQLAVEVLAALSHRFEDATLTMVGPDKGDGTVAATRASIERAGLQARIRVVEGIPAAAVAAMLDAHDIFLNTSNTDNTPVSVIEAMAAGLLTISTRAGGVPYLLTDGSDSLLVPIGAAEAMSAAVASVLEHPELAERLSLGGRATALRHDWSRVLPLWQQLFRALGAPSAAASSSAA